MLGRLVVTAFLLTGLGLNVKAVLNDEPAAPSKRMTMQDLNVMFGFVFVIVSLLWSGI